MTRVLIADDDVDSHELIDDLIEINFRDVTIDHALTKESCLDKIRAAETYPSLVLFNIDLDSNDKESIIPRLKEQHPELLDRVVFIASDQPSADKISNRWPLLIRPFSLDRFEEVVKRACAR